MINLKRQYGACQRISKATAVLLLSTTAVFAEPITIAAMGDSLTQGYGLQAEQGFVPQLQAWLDENGADAKIVNAGVSGDTTAGGLARAAWTLTPDVDAMIVALGGNDMLRGIDPAASKANLAGILDAAAAQDVDVLLIGMQAPGNFGPAYKEAFDGRTVNAEMYQPKQGERYERRVPQDSNALRGDGVFDPTTTNQTMYQTVKGERYDAKRPESNQLFDKAQFFPFLY